MRDVACRTRRSGKGPSRGGEGAHVVFVRRGAFAAHLGSREYIADPGTALVSWEETEYRISHPGDAGDDFTSFELAPELAEELLGRLAPRDDVELRLSPPVQMAYAAFLAVAGRGGDGLACEEAALELLASALGTASRAGAGRARRAIALAAIELLNQDLAARCSVSAIADQIGCSPGHLMHAFRAETGATLRGYRLRLRLGAALHRLAGGHADLAGLAADLGFASHAHLTDTFARLLGLPPREVRARIERADASSAAWVRTFLEARVRAAD